ncbi:MAG: hypothetical protein AAF560_09310 [Acidobacteriota bacterium]
MPTRKPINLRRDPTLRKGPVQHSKRVRRRVKAADSLLSSIRTLKELAVEGFENKLAEELRDGEVMPDTTLALELVGRSVARARDALLQADRLYCRFGMRRTELEGACRHIAQALYPEVVHVRRAVDSRFGRGGGRNVHFMEGHTRRRAKQLHPQLERLIFGLRHPQAWPPPVRSGPPGEAEHWLKHLEPGFESLTRALDDLATHELQEVTRRDDRDYELESFDLTFSEAIDFVRSVFRLAGCHEKVVWHLLSTGEQRRLKRKARQEREARAEGSRTTDPSGSNG